MTQDAQVLVVATDNGYITLYDTRKLEYQDPLHEFHLPQLLYNRLKSLIVHSPSPLTNNNKSSNDHYSNSSPITPLYHLFSQDELASNYRPSFFSSSDYTAQSIPTPLQLLSKAHKKVDHENNTNNNNNNNNNNQNASKKTTSSLTSLPIQSIALNPLANTELAFQLSNSSCGVIDLPSKKVTQYACVPTPPLSNTTTQGI